MLISRIGGFVVITEEQFCTLPLVFAGALCRRFEPLLACAVVVYLGGSLMPCGAVCVSVDERTIRADAYIFEPTSTSIMPDGVQSSRSFRAVCTHSSVRCAKMAKLRALADAARVTGWSIFKKALCRSCSLHCGERKKNI